MTMKYVTCRAPTGFTLIETIIAMLVLALVSVVIIRLNGGLFYRTTDIQAIQQSSLMVQACMDRIIGIRKSSDIFTAPGTTLPSTICDTTFLPSLSPGMTLKVSSAISTSSLCPSGKTCVQVNINTETSGVSKTPVTLFFVNY